MKNISIFKKIKLFQQFRKTLKENSFELSQKFNIRIDSAKRLYTVINIPPETVGEAYSLRKSDIDKISENFIREYSSELSKYLDSKNLNEMYDFYEMKKVDKYSYLLVFGFSLFKSNKYYNTLYWAVIPGITLSIITLLLIFL